MKVPKFLLYTLNNISGVKISWGEPWNNCSPIFFSSEKAESSINLSAKTAAKFISCIETKTDNFFSYIHYQK